MIGVALSIIILVLLFRNLLLYDTYASSFTYAVGILHHPYGMENLVCGVLVMILPYYFMVPSHSV